MSSIPSGDFSSLLDQQLPTVTLSSGIVQGKTADQYDFYLGIPYAEPPIGKLRFQLPLPVKPWNNIFDATIYGTSPAQYPPSVYSSMLEKANDIRSDDNWLTVNVWAPHNVHDAPVFVFIPGGSFVAGSNALHMYDGDSFARNKIVYVVINYRLGIEGFGVFPDAPSNRGLADQIQALQWVRDNIAVFGGDPHNITLGGHSAGSISVGNLLTSPQAKGLFHKAIMQSGTPIPLDITAAKNYTRGVAKELGTECTAKDFSVYQPDNIVAAMAKLRNDPQYRYRILNCGPIIDGEIITENPYEFLCRVSSSIPLLIGYTAHEFALWSNVHELVPQISWESFPTVTAKFGINHKIIEAYYDHYHTHTTANEAFTDLMSDALFIAPARNLIKNQASIAYSYVFSWESLENNHLSFHGLERPFVFDHLRIKGGEKLVGLDAPQELADQMHQAWINFICDGNPGWPLAGENNHLHEFTYPIVSLGQPTENIKSKLLSNWDRLLQDSPSII